MNGDDVSILLAITELVLPSVVGLALIIAVFVTMVKRDRGNDK